MEHISGRRRDSNLIPYRTDGEIEQQIMLFWKAILSR